MSSILFCSFFVVLKERTNYIPEVWRHWIAVQWTLIRFVLYSAHTAADLGMAAEEVVQPKPILADTLTTSPNRGEHGCIYTVFTNRA